MKVLISDLKREYEKFKSQYDLAFQEVMQSGWFILGDKVGEFETKFSQFIGSKFAVGVNSGLDALIIALRVLGVGKDDEVIVPANTFIATVLAITVNGAKPVFVEPDEFYNINPFEIEKAITIKTKAIIVVHLYGQAARMDLISSIAKKHNVYLIEDCAQSHGAMYKNIRTGNWGDISCFSFYPTKNLGAFGDGGMILTNSETYYNKLKLLRNYGSKEKYVFEECGYNSRLDELQAALLLVKFSHIETIINNRVKIASIYNEKIQNNRIEKPKTAEYSDHIYHLYVVSTSDRKAFQKYLSENGVQTQIHYPIPPHLSHAYGFMGHSNGDFPITENMANSVVSIPMHEWMTIEEIEHVIKVVNDFK